jgi:hypothetical protein
MKDADFLKGNGKKITMSWVHRPCARKKLTQCAEFGLWAS